MPVRTFKPGEDDAAVLGLRAAVWGADHDHTDPRFFKWLFRDTPEGFGTGIVAERDGEVVGFAGIANRAAQSEDTRIRVAHGLDFMVDPGIGKMLSGRIGMTVLNAHAELARRVGYDCNLNYPNDHSHRMLISRRVNYAQVFEPTLHVCLLGVVASSDSGLARRLGLRLAGTAGGFYGRLRFGWPRRADDIRVVEDFDDAFDHHWQRLVRDGKLRFVRDAAALHWRYRMHPGRDYTVLAAHDGGQVNGYAVTTRRVILGLDALLLCDLCVAENDPATAHALLGSVRSLARQEGIRLIATQALRAGSAARALRRAGFLAVPDRANPKPFRMICAAYTDRGSSALDGSAWSFGWGDTDVV